jgi:uncharacterized membrane protein
MKLSICIKEWFFTGFFMLIPLMGSFVIIRGIVNLLSRWFYPIHNFIPLKLHILPYSEIIIVILLIIIIGYIIQKFLLHRIISVVENNIIQKIPLVNSLYFGIKQVLKIINHKDKNNEEQLVAWVRLPYKNIYCLGLMTGILPQELSPDKDKKYLCFFVPHTPNPITGYYITAAEEDCVFTSMTRQEAISMIISGGIIKPEK